MSLEKKQAALIPVYLVSTVITVICLQIARVVGYYLFNNQGLLTAL